MSRFPSLIKEGQDQLIDVNYAGTPPATQRFRIISYTEAGAQSSNIFTKVQIKYPKAGSYYVEVEGGSKLEEMQFNDDSQKIDDLPNVPSGVGQYRFEGVNVNTLSFWMKSNTNYLIK